MGLFDFLESICHPFSLWILFYTIFIDYVISMVFFAFTIAIVSVGIGLSITVIGIPLLAYGLLVVRFFGVIELSIVRWHTEIVLSLPSPSNMSSEHSMMENMKRMIINSYSWKCVLYFAVVKPIVAIFNFVIMTVLLSLTLAFVSNIVVLIFFDELYDDLRDQDWGTVGENFKWPIVNWEGSIGLVVLGLCFGVVTLFAAQSLCRMSHYVARSILVGLPDKNDFEDDSLQSLTQPYARLQPKYSKRRLLSSSPTF